MPRRFPTPSRAASRAVSVPSLILQVEDDVVAPMEVGRYLEANLRDSTLRVIEGTGHCPHVSHRRETILAIRDDLRDRALQAMRA